MLLNPHRLTSMISTQQIRITTPDADHLVGVLRLEALETPSHWLEIHRTISMRTKLHHRSPSACVAEARSEV